MDQSTRRYGNVDALRIVAAVGVISLHVGDYPELGQLAADIIRSAFRWCVPFFFMVTGYFLASETSPFPRVTLERLGTPFLAFVVASTIFLPLLVAREGVDGITMGIYARGTYGHLWYLTALLIALLALTFLPVRQFRTVSYAAIVAIAAAFVLINYFYAVTGRRYELVMALRELSGIPAIVIGGLMRVHRDRLPKIAPALFVGGIILLVAEMFLLRAVESSPSDVQFFASTLPISAGLLGLALISNDVFPRWLGELGTRESLGVYLYHPIGIFIAASMLAGDIRVHTEGLPSVPMWIIASVCTITSMVLLTRYLPKLRIILDGRFRITPAGDG